MIRYPIEITFITIAKNVRKSYNILISVNAQRLSKYTQVLVLTGLEQKYIFTYPTLPHEQDVTHGQYLSGVLLTWIKSFLSSRLIAIPKFNHLVISTIYP